MTKDVIVSIRGVQFENDPQETIEVITGGEYTFEGDKHQLIYDEVSEETSEVFKSEIKFDGNRVEIIKNGAANTHMVFEEGKKNVTYYDTPYGGLLVGILASRIKIEERENNIDIKISYFLEINSQHVSNCEIVVSIEAKENAVLHL